MKRFLRNTAMLLAVCTAVGTFAACKKKEDPRASRPNTLSVTVFDAGYGSQWLQDVADYYMDNVDLETYVKITPTVLNVQEGTKVKQGLVSSDVYFLEDRFESDDPLLDLTEFVNGYPTGETEHTVLEKMGGLSAYYKKDGKFVALPYSDNHYYSFAANKTILTEALGAEGTDWSLPRTTDEFFALGDRLAEKDVYLMGAALADNNDYFDTIARVWFAQYAGWEAYENYMNGRYKDGSEWKFAETEPFMIDQQKDAIKAKYEVTKRLFDVTGGYMHKDSGSMDFMKVETSFMGYGYGVGNLRQAFVTAGPWLENESSVLKDSFGDIGKQDIVMIKTPVISALRDKLEGAEGDSDAEKEKKLRDLIDCVDKVETPPDWASPADVKLVSEARNMVAKNTIGSIVVPASTKKADLAKKFLGFVVSDVARIESMKATKGINMLSFDAFADEDEDTPEFSDYIRSAAALTEGALCVDVSPSLYPFADYGKFNIDDAAGGYSSRIFSNSSTNVAVQTADQIFTSLRSYYASQWGNMVSAYRAEIAE